jgi:hypothetical protein
MGVAGYDLSFVIILQVIITAGVVTVFAFATSMQEGRADHIGKSQMILYISFLTEHGETAATLKEITEASDEHISNATNEIYWMAARLEHWRETGRLPERKLAADTTIFENILALFFAPITSLVFLLQDLVEYKSYRVYIIMHTELRRNYMSKVFLIAIGSTVYLIIGLLVLVSGSRPIGIALVVLAFSGLLASMILAAVLTWAQQAWKIFWSDSFLHIMARAAKEKDHDLFNRAIALKAEVDRSPFLPLPGGLGLYAGGFSVIQGVVLGVSKLVER